VQIVLETDLLDDAAKARVSQVIKQALDDEFGNAPAPQGLGARFGGDVTAGIYRSPVAPA